MSFYVTKINFMQNDDWVHYLTVMRFLRGNFTLEPVIGSTFLVQGLFGYLFSIVFGLSKLPFLTLLISIGNFYMFSVILSRLKVKTYTAILLGLLMFFNPLHIYLAMGFMIENYLLFFTLLSVNFYLLYKDKATIQYLYIALLIATISFFIKQLGIVLIIVYVLDTALHKKWKESAYTTLVMSLTIIFYYLLFPRTLIMREQSLDVSVFSNFPATMVFVSQTVIYLVAFVLPLCIYFVYKKFPNVKKSFSLNLAISFLASLGVFYTVYYLGRQDFPYFGNTFTLKGFFPGGLVGNKYHFAGFYDLFRTWKYVSLLVGTLFVWTYLVSAKNKKISIFEIYIGVYILVCTVLPYFFDRYYVLLFPFVIATIVYRVGDLDKLWIVVTASFVIFLALFSYHYSADYISWQKYVWNRAEELSMNEHVIKNEIASSRAWNKYHDVNVSKAKYVFSFDSPIVLQNPSEKLMEVHNIEFPLNIWVNPKVYLYKAK